jgi:hypothetical protein
MYRFYLTYNNVQTEVEEPKGWSDFKSEKLGFADGRDILEEAFQLEGFDAEVLFTVDRRQTDTDVWINEFEGNTVMKNRELTDLYFNVDFEVSTFQQKVINRLNTKVRLDATEDLEGNTLSGPISSNTDSWGDIRLINRYIADFRTGAKDTLFNTYSKSHITTNGTPVYSHLIVNYEGEIQDNFGDVQVISELFSTGQISSSSGDQNFIVNSENAGDVTVTGTFKYKFYGTLSTSSTSFIPINLRAYLRHEDSTGALQSQQQAFIKTIVVDGNASPIAYDSGVLSESLSGTVTGVSASDRIFLYFEVEADVNDGGTVATTNATNIDIYYNSRAIYSLLKEANTQTVRHYHVHDVIERILYIITGEESKLYSDFLGITELGYSEDGCGGLTSITNGSLLRGDSNVPEISLSDVLKSLQAIYGVGYSFENVYGDYRMRIELMEYFYGDTEIVDLGSPVSIKENGSYIESTFDDLLINTVEIGFAKFTNDENNTGDIDDFLTKSEYALPVKTITGEYNQISPLIASGRLIQAAYEAKVDLSKSWKNDNDNFIIKTVRSSDDFIPELNENFETLTGFDNSSEDTAYNIRFAPVYMFLNHALIINSVLMGKSLDEVITNTSVEINKDFSAKFKSSETCRLADEQRLTRSSSGNINIEDNYVGYRLFDPVQHELTVAMTKEQLDLIIDAMENNATDEAKNYGYLSYRDNEGNPQQGYPILIQWNPNDEIANITTLEKADNYGV